jgi:hypothetical protein
MIISCHFYVLCTQKEQTPSPLLFSREKGRPLRLLLTPLYPVALAAGARAGCCRAGLGCLPPLYSSRSRFLFSLC